MATVKIPPVLRPSVGGEKEVSASGTTVGAVLQDLAGQHPATQDQLFGPDGSLNRYVNAHGVIDANPRRSADTLSAR